MKQCSLALVVALGASVWGLPQAGLAQSRADAMQGARLLAQRTVVFKVADSQPVTVNMGQLQGDSQFLLDSSVVLSGLYLERYFTQSYAELETLRNRAISRGSWPHPADLNQYFRVEMADAGAAQTLVLDLTAVAGVDHVYLQPGPADTPDDIPPTTADWTHEQEYFHDADGGTMQNAVAGVLGAQGQGIRITDCEYDWVLDHEDLELNPANLVGGDPIGIFADHGTAVAGQLVSMENEYGMTGGVPQADFYMATEYAVSWGFNPTQAIVNATASSTAGDLILLEMQTAGPTGAYVPEEWTPASFDAIQLATGLGIHVIEAGGNGSMNLDDSIFGGWFDTVVQDSRAILVGAGTADAPHAKMWFTSHGSRLDCQAWGEKVYTTGYGWLWEYGPDDRQDYTFGFSGTSSASPIVTSAVAAVLGAMKAHGMTPPDPESMRVALRQTGTPQDPFDVASGRIGSLPHLEQLFAYFQIPTGLRHAPVVELGNSLTFEMSGLPGESFELWRARDAALIPTKAGMRVLGYGGFRLVGAGLLDAAGQATLSSMVPVRPPLAGMEIYTQVLFNDAGALRLSNGGAVTLH
jgi:subtilase family protein